uniref:Uncharacterized protein n=1 Tax=Cryptomonas curvata TaxID=233186 RepID=A0A7S0MLC6_9CRYP|mmetsp:Transcript_43300/g.90684  ORF Transcript_43300/g.90684 Transcript_43300/m.90684 type:complete len:206 (+) Transcript_43300:73-690(+)
MPKAHQTSSPTPEGIDNHTKRARPSPKMTFDSPNCVSSEAETAFSPPFALELKASGKDQGDHFELPHVCWWQELMRLKGKKLIDRLEEIKLEEMIDYHGGLLNEDFTKAIVNLYDHVISEGDDQSSPNCIYNAESLDDMKLPHWIAKVDEHGVCRKDTLTAAVEFDVFQWWQITTENFSLLDTVVWMGVQIRDKMEDGSWAARRR